MQLHSKVRVIYCGFGIFLDFYLVCAAPSEQPPLSVATLHAVTLYKE